MKGTLFRKSTLVLAMVSTILSCKKGDPGSADADTQGVSGKGGAYTLACAAQGWASQNGGTSGGQP